MPVVRAECAARDGYCRLAGVARFPPCSGPSEWAHVGEHRRFKTRGMEPEARHTTAGSVMFCADHHHLYDANRLQITALTERQCDGPLRYELDGVVYEEVR